VLIIIVIEVKSLLDLKAKPPSIATVVGVKKKIKDFRF
tara:strand:+ start:5773 stop:5886 length:114 start_codon:yes stop_codon:yes gene_type:complete